jgi:hypothetical protein
MCGCRIKKITPNFVADYEKDTVHIVCGFAGFIR